MWEPLVLLFLIVSYNFLLWFLTSSGLSPVPLFPQDPNHVVIVLSYNSVLYVSWFFGERERAVKWMGYLFFLQIVALSVYFQDPGVIARDLSPVILTFTFVVLFESPTERRIRSIEKEREELLKEIERVRREREEIEERMRNIREEIERVKREEREERIKELQKELEDYREKERRLLETNRRLFRLLESLKEDARPVGSKEEVSSLRKERKKLIKEIVGLQELLEVYTDENEKLKEENESLRRKLEEMNLRLGKMELERGKVDEKLVYRDVLEGLLQIRFSERAVEEFLDLPVQKKRFFLKELLRFSLREGQEKVEPIVTLQNVYKLRLPGGRVYLRRWNRSWEVVGLLDSEDDKEKERYIRNVLSRIDT